MNAPVKHGSFGPIQLELHAQELGTKLRAAKKVNAAPRHHLQIFRKNVRQIEDGHQIALKWASESVSHSPVVEWLLDNYPIVRDRIRDVLVHLPRKFFSELPRMQDGTTRIQIIADELILHSDSSLDDVLIVQFIDNVQERCELTIGECWALGTFLKLSLIERLSYICEDMEHDYVASKKARDFLDRLERSQVYDREDLRSLDEYSSLVELHMVASKESSFPANLKADVLHRIQSKGLSLEVIQRIEQQRLAACQVSIGNVITSLRLLDELDWPSLFEQINLTERVLRNDPTGVYERMDFHSRNYYRGAIEELSSNSHTSESKIARIAIEFAVKEHTRNLDPHGPASHVGYWLIDDGMDKVAKAIDYCPGFKRRALAWIGKHPNFTYLGSLLFLFICVMTIFGLLLSQSELDLGTTATILLLAILPASEMALQSINAFWTQVLPVKILPKLELKDGIPQKHPTFVVVPCMIATERDVDVLLTKLESHFLANAEPGVRFALLSDFTDSDTRSNPVDDSLIQLATVGIEKLNDRYKSMHADQPFFLFHRFRTWNDAERTWMGWERKRGKLLEFGEFLQGGRRSSYQACVGNLQSLEPFGDPSIEPFVITLDADTVLPRDTVRRLIGALAHPLNRPHIDIHSRLVTRGYGILQPRVSVQMEKDQRSWYHRIFASGPGIDPYAFAASDVYQDVYSEGSFTGKGIYDLRAFESVLDSRFPENRILSHDLIEGCHVRVAYTSDIEVFDSYPQRYDVDTRRHHRWTRGDWQIASWLWAYVPSELGTTLNPLSRLSHWKILDNLRRSLVPIAIVLLLLFCFAINLHASFLVSAVLGVVAFWPTVLSSVLGLRGLREIFADEGIDRRGYIAQYWTDITRSVARNVFLISVLPHRAWLMVDAIIRTIWRVVFSHKNLLEWETASASETRLMAGKNSLLSQLAPCGLLGIFLMIVAIRQEQLWLLPWTCLWLISPVLVHSSSALQLTKASTLEADQHRFLLEILSSTWGYFERFVDPQSNPLPPDNFQELPDEKIANRISPTNEGLFLVAALSARHFGFVTHHQFAEYLERNLDAWLKLEKHNGHHLNWYDTKSGRALSPRYVSTVDSGNLLACYLTLSQGLEVELNEPIIGTRHYASAMAGIAWLKRVTKKSDGEFFQRLEALPILFSEYEPSWRWLKEMRLWLLDALVKIEQRIIPENADPIEINVPHAAVDSHQVSRIVARRFRSILEELDRLMPWIKSNASSAKEGDEMLAHLEQILPASISLKQLASFNLALLNELLPNSRNGVQDDLSKMTEVASTEARRLIECYRKLQTTLDAEVAGMQFGFLYSSKRKLFSIGFNAESLQLDKSYYDMLASECRLSSYLAIAKGDVKTEHWFHLGRQSAEIDGRFGLLSWGGTMFEYLMPTLFQRVYNDSILERSCATAIRRQVKYGASKGLVWGVSESAYSARANNSDYLYKSFGVPGLGLKRGLTRDYVVSPYSTVLALPFAPRESLENLFDLSFIAMGTWGFYDAVDFTKSRLRRREKYAVVRNYMAHHQGMTILAIANALDRFVVQRWFHANPIVRASELLLQEKSPSIVTIDKPDENEIDEFVSRTEGEAIYTRRIRGYRAFPPKTLFLSNREAHTMLTHVGGSCFRWNDIQVTRWRPDATRDHYGVHIYLRDHSSGFIWSAAYQPTLSEPDEYESLFAVDKGSIRRRQGNIETTMEVTVSPEHDAEVRLLRIANLGTESVTLDVTSFSEIALIHERSDVAHPAFYKLFVETEFVPEDNSIVARRRPRDRRDSSIYAVHTIAVPPEAECTIQYDSSRESFIGRGRTCELPAGMESPRLAKNVGPVIDPAFVLRCTVTILPGDSVLVGFTTACAKNRDDVLSIADHYQELRGVQRAFELSWAQSQVELQHLNLSAQQLHSFQRLGGNLIYPNRALRGDTAKIVANRLNQSSLWRFGISGDHPLILARITTDQDVLLAKELLLACRYLASRGLHAELVLCNDYPGGYFDEIQARLQLLVEETLLGEDSAKRVFVLRGAQLTREDHQLLDAVATVLLRGDRGSLADQLDIPPFRFSQLPRSSRSQKYATKPANSTIGNDSKSPDSARKNAVENARHFSNGFGTFGSGVYQMVVSGEKMTPAPWSNVLSNAEFGCLITEAGSGFTWSKNSRENKLSSWSNDPTSDPPSEVLYLYDLDSDLLWSPLNLLDSEGPRAIEHRHGSSKFQLTENGIESETIVSVDWNDPIKRIRIKLRNVSEQNRRFRLTFYVETVLGVNRDSTATHQHTEIHSSGHAIVARNGFHPELPDQIVFLATQETGCRFTGNRTEFLNPFGSYLNPVGAIYRLTNHSGAALDPCLAIQCDVELDVDKEREIEFVFGAADNEEHFNAILEKNLRVTQESDEIKATATEWAKVLKNIQIESPNASMDILFNDWLLYQTLSCRIWGRSAFYQSGGALGFRDQLQDVMATVYSRPDLTRKQILLAAARQYPDGSVQHWWHPPSGKGTKTRFSDDFLFLPFVVSHYCSVTGDLSILQEQVSFIESLPLMEHEQERYEQPTTSESKATLLEHCKLALKHGMRYGAHGLPLMGCGDWNDGMNRLGEGGKGESVWVAWFQVRVFRDFANLLDSQAISDSFSQLLRNLADDVVGAIEKHGWDGEWYRRAFFDDGGALGGSENVECQIDSLTQSWSIIANGSTERTIQAFNAAVDRLYDRDAKMIKLFEPPFDREERGVGYIQGYLPGVRENGGQYTHAALWMVGAATKLGNGNLAQELFNAINPMNHSKDKPSALQYKLEPYVIAADVYANKHLMGRGGWSWYTGSAAWMYRVVLEDILGFHFSKDGLSIDPCVSDSWTHFTVTLKRNSTTWKITVNLIQTNSSAPVPVFVNLFEDGRAHEIVVDVVNRTVGENSTLNVSVHV